MDSLLTTRLILKNLVNQKSVSLIATGNSMYPYIKSGQKVKIYPAKLSQVKVSDIIVYQLKNKIIIHQCLFKSSQYLITYGLNNKFIDPPVLPSQVIGFIKQPNYWQIVSLIYQAELKTIQKLLPSVKFIILKGPIWQKSFYGYQTNFPFSDIDILIKKKDYPKLAKILVKLKYRQKQGHHINKKHYTSAIPSVSEISFCKKINGIKIEFDLHLQAVRSALHKFNCAPICKKNMDNLTKLFWQTAISDQGFIFLQNEYLLLYLCSNLIFHHGLRDIKVLSYIAKTINDKNINWHNFFKLVNFFHLDNFIYYPLFYASFLYKVKVPKLTSYKPYLTKKFLLKFLINKYLIFYPFNCGQSLPNWLNSRFIFLLRLILK